MKKNLMKIASLAVSAIMMFGTVSNAAEAQMYVSAPATELAAWEVPADETERNNLITALNGIDDGTGTVVKSKDLGNGWSVHQSTGTWSVTSGYLYCNGGRTYVKSNDEFSGLDKPFELDVAYTIAAGLYIRLGRCKEFGDSVNDYYELSSLTSSNIGYGNNKIVLSRVKDGTTTVTSAPFYQWGTTVAKLTFDGSKLSLSTTTNATPGSNDWCKLDIADPVTDGKVYFKGDSKHFYLKNVSLTKLAASLPVDRFYVGLENFTAADVSADNLEAAGWTITAARDTMESVDGQIISPIGNLNLRYESDLSGDYTIETKIYKQYNGSYLKFGYVDESNYYVLASKYMPVGKYYNAETQTVDTIDQYTYKPVDGHNFYFIKVSDGVAYLINSQKCDWASVTKNISINMAENEDGSETITVNAPVAFTYTDVAGDTDGAPITKGKFYYQGVNEGKSIIDYVRIYPTDNKEDISFDLYVDGTKAEGDTLSKGNMEISMPVKYAGTRNKILVALYQNHAMTDVKVFEASDFYTEDKIEVFDTTNCSDDAEVAIMMWNSLDEIKPIITKIPVMSVQ